ncbi:MAG: C39 family peptidase [Bacilli bacterium]|nr:C39 family peptidase [Bacilli bacterium]
MNKDRIRFKQRDYHLEEIDKLDNINWCIEKYGCGPTSIANILVNLGFDIDPIYTTKKILFDKNETFDDTYLRNKGINEKGLLYCLDRLIKEDNYNITYEIVKINFNNPDEQKTKIINLLKQGYMAIIHVGPYEKSSLTFSKNGHYLVISDIDENNKFYVINSNEIGDRQIGKAFEYDEIIKNIYGRKDSFNFLFIGKI